MTDVVGKGNAEPQKYSINLLGEYNIGGDEWEISRVLSKIGYHIVTTMTGNATYDEMSNAHISDLNLVQCHRSINYIADMMETKYGIPWMKVNFIGIRAMSKSLRDLAKYFGDEALIARTEEVIAEEVADIEDQMEFYKDMFLRQNCYFICRRFEGSIITKDYWKKSVFPRLPQGTSLHIATTMTGAMSSRTLNWTRIPETSRKSK
jgi:nitrogenase molybdenum-iron protein alpha/beta subunit